MKSTHSDPLRDDEIPNTVHLEIPAEPDIPFDEADMKWSELLEIVIIIVVIVENVTNISSFAY